jgi:hypothetical protein
VVSVDARPHGTWGHGPAPAVRGAVDGDFGEPDDRDATRAGVCAYGAPLHLCVQRLLTDADTAGTFADGQEGIGLGQRDTPGAAYYATDRCAGDYPDPERTQRVAPGGSYGIRSTTSCRKSTTVGFMSLH